MIGTQHLLLLVCNDYFLTLTLKLAAAWPMWYSWPRCDSAAYLWVSLVLCPADGDHPRTDEAGHVVYVAVDHLGVTYRDAATSSNSYPQQG
jgi:hypothetical protein